MSAEWYYETDGQQQHGPVTAQQLKQLAVNGFLQPTHLVWKEGVPKKVPASAVKGLFTDLKKPAGEAPVKAPAKPTAARPKQDEVVDLEPIDDVVDLQPIEEIVDLQPIGPPAPGPAAPRPPALPPSAPALARHGAKGRGVAMAGVPAPPAESQAAPASAPSRPSGGGSAPAGSGKFRVMHGGKMQGPFTLGEIRRLLDSNKLNEDDLIGLEIWVPVASLGGLFSGGGGGVSISASFSSAGAGKKTAGKEMGETIAELEELGEPEVLDDLPLAPNDSDAPLPVDPDLLNFGSDD